MDAIRAEKVIQVCEGKAETPLCVATRKKFFRMREKQRKLRCSGSRNFRIKRMVSGFFKNLKCVHDTLLDPFTCVHDDKDTKKPNKKVEKPSIEDEALEVPAIPKKKVIRPDEVQRRVPNNLSTIQKDKKIDAPFARPATAVTQPKAPTKVQVLTDKTDPKPSQQEPPKTETIPTRSVTPVTKPVSKTQPKIEVLTDKKDPKQPQQQPPKTETIPSQPVSAVTKPVPETPPKVKALTDKKDPKPSQQEPPKTDTIQTRPVTPVTKPVSKTQPKIEALTDKKDPKPSLQKPSKTETILISDDEDDSDDEIKSPVLGSAIPECSHESIDSESSKDSFTPITFQPETTENENEKSFESETEDDPNVNPENSIFGFGNPQFSEESNGDLGSTTNDKETDDDETADEPIIDHENADAIVPAQEQVIEERVYDENAPVKLNEPTLQTHPQIDLNSSKSISQEPPENASATSSLQDRPPCPIPCCEKPFEPLIALRKMTENDKTYNRTTETLVSVKNSTFESIYIVRKLKTSNDLQNFCCEPVAQKSKLFRPGVDKGNKIEVKRFEPKEMKILCGKRFKLKLAEENDSQFLNMSSHEVFTVQKVNLKDGIEDSTRALDIEVKGDKEDNSMYEVKKL